ncbi:SDR family oxidoreductase [Clostridium beijerinckii]|uniref:SDR family oxidoreductase n=1 Tax=Clostridium beijerinckii TaxID=1520 RepID=A0A7X9XMM6_CLOBE|nr:SDR family oxidoreductase [Clostridium beijerinckii]
MLKGKNAIITGANRGIGRKTVEIFAQNGANIWACARKKSEEFENEINQLSRQYDVSIEPIYFDLSISDEIKNSMKKIISEKKYIDILVNNAGMVSENKLFHMTTIEEMKSLFEVNFFSHILITQYISRVMLRQKYGSIVNIASVAALDGDPAQLEYVSSKAAIIGATKKLAIELGKNNVRVNALAPGLTDTEMASNMTDEYLERTVQNTIMKRLGSKEEIANAIMFLASDLSSYITGQVIRVDGGVNIG